MNNRYISRYAKHDTQFQRTDPFPLARFDDEDPLLDRYLISACFILSLVLLVLLLLIF